MPIYTIVNENAILLESKLVGIVLTIRKLLASVCISSESSLCLLIIISLSAINNIHILRLRRRCEYWGFVLPSYS